MSEANLMQHKGYAGLVEYDAEERVFHGRVIGIRDVVNFEGETVDEIETAFRESVDDYLAFCKKRGESPDKPYSGKLLLRLPPQLHRKLDVIAQSKGVSLNNLIVGAVDEIGLAEVRVRGIFSRKSDASRKRLSSSSKRTAH